MSKEPELILPLVKIPGPESTKENSIWATSPERLGLPQKPFHHSNSSDSLSVSESGSDIFSKREVIHKLRQQLKRRDDMILEMQAQITELQHSLSSQLAQSTHLQAQLGSVNRDLFDSEREIQRLRNAIADHSGGTRVGSIPENIGVTRNGFSEGEGKFELEVNVDEGRGGHVKRVEMLKREVGELKEVIEGKDFLVHSYKEQKIELSSKMKDLQLRVASQIPNIL
eukprot:TRINITY_DN4551_c0_g1_i5.p1 TRINITY_DN4551_c0_g1~~TRINITY_DN4551_c0_g1_i5.p1  ORF type:complete len:242 (+),score=55.09 TRINITY_DN4551_c0_g1_i5:49-726(+)